MFLFCAYLVFSVLCVFVCLCVHVNRCDVSPARQPASPPRAVARKRRRRRAGRGKRKEDGRIRECIIMLEIEEEGEEGREGGKAWHHQGRKEEVFSMNKGEGIAREILEIQRKGRREARRGCVCWREGGREGGSEGGRLKQNREALLSV